MAYKRKAFSIWLVLTNIILIVILVVVLFVYSQNKTEEQFEESKSSLSINSDKIAAQLEAYFANQYSGLLDRKQYLQDEANQFDIEAAMEYLSASNADDRFLYQLVDCRYTYVDDKGNFTYDSQLASNRVGIAYHTTSQDENGQKLLVDGLYKSDAFGSNFTLAWQKEVDDGIINTFGQYTIPFTYYVNGGTEKRNYEQGLSIYTIVKLPGEKQEQFLLMCVVAMEDILQDGIPTLEYENADSVLINDVGIFIYHTNNLLNSSNDTYWSYLREVYGLSSVIPVEVQTLVQSQNSGICEVLSGKGGKQCDCVMAFVTINSMPGCKFLSIVPEEALRNSNSTDWSYTIIIMSFVLLLIVLDGSAVFIFARRLKHSLKQTEEAVESANQANRSKSLFLSRMSHEIRTPLNAIIGYNTIARNEITSVKTDADRRLANREVVSCLNKSEVASKHLLTIINDVLDMSAIDSGKMQISHEQFDFKSLITSLTTIFYAQARAKGINFDVVFDTMTEEWFVGDQMRTNQILTNILSNAIKFTPDGGTVTLTVSQPEASTKESHIHFRIADTGIGMTEEYLSHIWAPFEQADSSISRRFGGTGLGLSITKNLVDMMNGKIAVASTPGKGTVFDIDLTFEPAKQLPTDKSYDFSRVNCLVVDDDNATCDYIKLLCNRSRIKCDTVNSGEEALRAITASISHEDPYTLCIVDWRMPKMDGIETIKRIRELAGEELPITILTAYDFTEISQRVKDVKIDKFLSKPMFQSSLFDMLVSICGAESKAPIEQNETYDFDGVTVMLVEDAKMNMEIAKKLLQSANLTVESAWNGKEAVDLFEQSDPGTIKAILMDINMPEMDGLEATRVIRASSHPEADTVPIIAMTADAFVENVTEALAAGMDAHISKPIDFPTLFSILRKYIK